MIDNSELIKRLLTFDSEDDFYFLQILKRRKDNPGMNKDMIVIDNLFIYNPLEIDQKFAIARGLCNQNNARAYIRVNRRSKEKVALYTLKKITEYIISKDYKAVKNAYLSAAGETHNEPLKRWIVDVDTKDAEYLDRVQATIADIHLNMALGTDVNNTTLLTIPTKAGYHIICNPFNVQEFRKCGYFQEDIHKDNPTLLYIP